MAKTRLGDAAGNMTVEGVVEYTCNAGFMFTDDSVTTSLTCDDQVWLGDLPVCEGEHTIV